MVYTGPIVYITHSPPRTSDIHSVWTKDLVEIMKGDIHLKKMVLLIKFARRHNLPIVFDVINELQEQRLEQLLNGLNLKLKDVYILDSFYEDNELRERFKSFEIVPTKAIMSGWYKERCCLETMQRLKQEFPKCDLIALRGDFNIPAKEFALGYKPEEKEKYDKFTRENKVRRASLKRNLVR